MSKIPVKNNGAMPIWVGGTMIPAGETRHFDPHHVPPEHRPARAKAESEAPPADPLQAIQSGSVKAIVAGIEALTDDELGRLEELEQAGGAPRKGVMEAIAAERLRRAAQGQGGDDGTAAGNGGEGGGA